MKAQTVRARGSRVAVGAGLTAVMTVLTGGIASADPVLDSPASFTLTGPVGFAAVALGVGGVILGLYRRRRDTAAAAAVTTEIAEPAVVQVPIPVRLPAARVTTSPRADQSA